MENGNSTACVAIIGAGPAGLFAARELAQNGINVILFNRDIKPGGLAEYGIYPDKDRIKDGLRCQFREILQTPGVYYYGNTPIGEKNALSISDLKDMGFDAILVATGAQGTKWLGLQGEECQGVYHAKELVLHYNHLPPFASTPFHIGKRVAIVGVGNVMTDIVRYLATLPQVEEITTVARRGLAEIKFDSRELEHTIGHLLWPDFQLEAERVAPVMAAVGQDPQACIQAISQLHESIPHKHTPPVWRMHFLLSPVKILCEDGKVHGVQLEMNVLENTQNGTKAKGTGVFVELPIDTIIFAIGDVVDQNLGLPMKGSGYAISESPRFPVNEISFELDQEALPGEDLTGVFVCGWSRNASKGMVGIARRDGVNAARAVIAYLKEHPAENTLDSSAIEARLIAEGYKFVTLADLEPLEAAEKEHALQSGQGAFKFDTNEEMLRVMNKIA